MRTLLSNGPSTILAVLLILAAPHVAVPAQQATPDSLDAFQWLAGAWRATQGQSIVEEHWTDAGGNMMLGIGRTIAGGKTVFFEFLRIEARPDGIYHVVQPNGRAGTEFKLTRFDGTTAVFENPQHDFPKRVLYRRHADGSITARIDGGEGVEEGARDFHFLPLK